MYKIKLRPEDFFVEELCDLSIKDTGDYCYFAMEKKNWNTMDVIKTLANRLRINQKRFNVAGMKDKNAVTRQVFSVFRVPKNAVLRIKIRDVHFEFLGYGDERLKLGQIIKNRFRIVVRNLASRKYRNINFIENYYDEQRFGGKNQLVGKALVKKEFSNVCSMLKLNVNKNDYIGAIRNNLDKKMLIFYINAYQSMLFNKLIAEYVKIRSDSTFKVGYETGEFIFSNKEIKNKKIPLIGFLSVIRDREIKKLYERILREEEVSKEDFLFPMMPELGSEGNERDFIVEVNVKVKYEDDDMNEGRYKAILDFALNRGSYATIVVKKMFG